MLKSLVVAVITSLAFAGGASLTPAFALDDQVINVPNEDADMAAAITKARASLPEFFKVMEKPPAGIDGFSLKVKIPYGDGNLVEHFWLADIERKGEKFAGTINNEPESATQITNGQRYEFGDADISDWMYMRNGKIVGNETMRPLFKQMSKEEADQYRAMLESP